MLRSPSHVLLLNKQVGMHPVDNLNHYSPWTRQEICSTCSARQDSEGYSGRDTCLCTYAQMGYVDACLAGHCAALCNTFAKLTTSRLVWNSQNKHCSSIDNGVAW